MNNLIAFLIINNSFESVSTRGNGGILLANYTIDAEASSMQYAVFNFTNNSFKAISAQNGGLIQFISKSPELIEFIFEANKGEDITVSQNGGIINFPDYI